MLESLFNNFVDLQVFSCKHFKIVKSSFFIEHLSWLFQQMFCFTLHFQKDVAEYIVVLNCIIVSFGNLKSLPFTFIRCTTRCYSLYHSLSFFVTRCHSLLFIVTRYHSLSLVVTRCTTRFHSLSLVVTGCRSLSFVVPLVVIRCHSMYH